MAKNIALKCCSLFVVMLLLVGGGILVWKLLTKPNSDNSVGSENEDKGGLFGTGLFAGNNNNNNNATTIPASMTPTTTIAPSAAPSAAPSDWTYKYEFHQCSPQATSCCNGLENLCDWPANDILYGIPHNAMATNDYFIVPNQLRPVEEALRAGFRGVGIDICVCQDEIKLCHGYCGLGEVDPFEFLEAIVTWMDQPENQNEVLLLTMELNSDAGQSVDLDVLYDTVLSQVEGLTDHLYVHDGPLEPWPTLGTLIANNKRLIAFHFNGPDCSEPGSCPDGLHYYFHYAQETEFDLPSIDAILDVDTSCVITRGATTTDGSFFGVNNFVTSGSLSFDLNNQLSVAAQANTLEFAKQRIEACSQLKENGLYSGDSNVNILYIDFWSIGDIVQLVQEHNRALGEYVAP